VLGCFAAAYFGASAIGPAFVQGVRGDPVSVTGLMTVPAGLAVGLTLQVATRLVDRVSPRRVILVGTATGLSGAVLSGVAPGVDAPYLVIGAVSVLGGIGSGATLMPTMVAATRNLDGPAATTLLTLFSQLGTALGTALVTFTITLMVDVRVDGLDRDGRGGLGAMVALNPAERAQLSDQLAAAVGWSYVTPAVLILAALLGCAWGMRTPRRAHPDARPSLANPPDRTQTRHRSHRDFVRHAGTTCFQPHNPGMITKVRTSNSG